MHNVKNDVLGIIVLVDKLTIGTAEKIITG